MLKAGNISSHQYLRWTMSQKETKKLLPHISVPSVILIILPLSTDIIESMKIKMIYWENKIMKLGDHECLVLNKICSYLISSKNTTIQ